MKASPDTTYTRNYPSLKPLKGHFKVTRNVDNNLFTKIIITEEDGINS